MIKYNDNTINDWNFGDDNIIKVYKHGAVCYYKITSGDTPTPVQEPCFAVVDNISQYSDTEFEDVFNKADGKWYKLNNLNQYEEYGVYGSGRNITYYDGKLTIDGDYEYQYSGDSWVNLGEVSGGTATLPDVPFTLNYNAKNYDASTHTIPYTEGALNAIDAVITGTTANIIDHHEDGYIQLTGSSSTKIRALVGTTNFSRSSSSPNITIICKAYTPGSSTEGNILSNRKESYNWMYRHKSSILTFHGQSEQGSIAVSNTEPNTCSVRIDSSRLLTYNNWTKNTTSTYSNFNYGSNSNGGALFAGYYSSSGEMWKGVFYWIYMSLNTLTDKQVQQVIAYNEGGGGQSEYPKYYDEIQDPPDNLVFSSMAEAEAYECPWVGMKATIAGDKYVFSGDSISGYEWVYQPPSACEYNFCGVDANGNDVIINNGTTSLTQFNWTSQYPVEGIVGAATTTIGMYCFNVISGTLTALTIGNTVTTIEHEAFMNTSLLTTLTIPSSVTQIDFWAFTRCNGLNEVIFEGTTPPTFTNQYSGVFHDYCPPVIYVPDSAVSAYRAIAGSVWTNQTWSTSIIQPISNRT